MASSGNDSRKATCDLGIILPLEIERAWSNSFRIVVYIMALFYCFLGLTVVTDAFVSAILIITSKTKKVYLSKPKKKQIRRWENEEGSMELEDDRPEMTEVRVWNVTVASLTLLAVGNSAPEIFLAIIETIGHGFESQTLGPGTIVGCAAFNLLMITSLCMCSVPRGETRRIRKLRVFIFTSVVSVLAYFWIVIVLMFISPHMVELWEAFLTFFFFPIFIFLAYGIDKKWYFYRFAKKSSKSCESIGVREEDEIFPSQSSESERRNTEMIAIAFVKEMSKHPLLSEEDTALLAASRLSRSRHLSIGHYQIQAIRDMTGSRKLYHRLPKSLQEVREVMNRKFRDSDSGESSEQRTDAVSVVEFNAAGFAIRRTILSLDVSLRRRGNLNREASVRVETSDGSAKANQDYLPIDRIVTFAKHEREKHVVVRIIDPDKSGPNKKFFLKLHPVDKNGKDSVELGRAAVTEITIVDREANPGIVAFEKRGYFVEESSEVAVLRIARKFGTEGEVTVRWRTINGTAVSGKDFAGGTGEIIFKHGEAVKLLEIPIMSCSIQSEKSEESFEVELFDPGEGSGLGSENKTSVIITNDEDFENKVDKVRVMIEEKMDAIAVGKNTWTSQMRDAFHVNGGSTGKASPLDYFFHFVSFFWKVIFSFIPPPTFCGGWISFFTSLFIIGALSVIIGDLAIILGCMVGLTDNLTALTVVTFGTALPDTLASRSAAIREKYADISVGNINGTNAVNVFLGLGLPWLIASIYHSIMGTTFVVPPSSLGFNVIIFSIIGIITNIVFIIRRNLSIFGRAELGGPQITKFLTSLFLFLIWIIYVMINCFENYGLFSANF